MDPTRVPSADILPGQLGLTEGEMEIARTAIAKSLAESIPISELLSTLETILINSDGRTVTEALLQELNERHTLLRTSIAYRAFALGRASGHQDPTNEEGQA